jgi:hypothetical protein
MRLRAFWCSNVPGRAFADGVYGSACVRAFGASVGQWRGQPLAHLFPRRRRYPTTSQIVLGGHFHPDGPQIGISLDPDLADLGYGFGLVGEVGATRFVAKSAETSLEIGIGARSNNL